MSIAMITVCRDATLARAYRPAIIVLDDGALPFPRQHAALFGAVRTPDVNAAVVATA